MSPHQSPNACARPMSEQARHAAGVEARRPAAAAAARSIWIAKPMPKSAAKIVMNLPWTSQSTSACATRSGIQVHISDGSMYARERRVEPAHVGGEDAEERGAAQAVDDGDALAAGDRPDRFGAQACADVARRRA